MFPRCIAVLAVSVLSFAPGFVQVALAQSEPLAIVETTTAVAASSISPISPVFFTDDQSANQPPREIRSGTSWTTPVLTSLQVATVATQMLDVHSTLRALNAGGVEANPMMSGLVRNRAAFIGVKAAMGAGLVYATHRLARNNKVGAIVLAAAVNSASVMIASHNYKVARNLR